MLNISYSKQFKRDYRLCQKRGLDIKILQSVVAILAIPDILPPKNKDHDLNGNYKNYRECHIAPDWLLIYRTTESELMLNRTGSHSDLF